jgi:hypothetical protein
MSDDTPTGTGDLADELIARVRSRRPEFEAAGERAEGMRTLPPGTVETLRGLGAWTMCSCRRS